MATDYSVAIEVGCKINNLNTPIILIHNIISKYQTIKKTSSNGLELIFS